MESFTAQPGPRLWTVFEGTGVPVVFLPGGPGCCDYLEPVAAVVEGARAVRYDPRGCGRSEGVERYTLADSIGDLERLREHHGLKRWFLAGHSAGADLALAYTLAHPGRVLGMACISGGRIHNDRDWHAAYAAARDAGKEPDLDYAYPPNLEVNRQLNAEWKAYIKRPELLHELSEVRAPALFIYGSEDIRPSWPVEQVAALIPGATFQMLQGAGHNCWLTHAEELGDSLTEFVGKHSTG